MGTPPTAPPRPEDSVDRERGERPALASVVSGDTAVLDLCRGPSALASLTDTITSARIIAECLQAAVEALPALTPPVEPSKRAPYEKAVGSASERAHGAGGVGRRADLNGQQTAAGWSVWSGHDPGARRRTRSMADNEACRRTSTSDTQERDSVHGRSPRGDRQQIAHSLRTPWRSAKSCRSLSPSLQTASCSQGERSAGRWASQLSSLGCRASRTAGGSR